MLAMSDAAAPPACRFYWRRVEQVLVVLDLISLEFTILNRTAGATWLALLDESWDLDELAGFIAEIFQVGAAEVELDLAGLVQQWIVLGWVETDTNGQVGIWTQTSELPSSPYTEISVPRLETVSKEAAEEWSRSMDFLGEPVSVIFYCDPDLKGSDISNRAQAFLSGVSETSEEVPDANRIHCYVTSKGIFLRRGASCVEAKDLSDGLSRLVLWCFYQGYGRSNLIGTFHAAALGRSEGAVLMPGLSGAGKSTLTAYLARNGWQYGGDDIVGLSKATGSTQDHLVLPFCSAVSVKEGALDLLADLYPGLRDLPVISYDLKQARFSCVPSEHHMPAEESYRKIGRAHV